MVQGRRIGHAIKEGHIDENLARAMLLSTALPVLDESQWDIEAKISRHLRGGMEGAHA